MPQRHFKLVRAFTLSLLLLTASATVVFAQTSVETTTVTETTSHNSGFDWGWLGILGLLGLMPRREVEETVVTDTNTARRM